VLDHFVYIDMLSADSKSVYLFNNEIQRAGVLCCSLQAAAAVKCNLFDKTLRMQEIRHFLHKSNTARRISVDVVSITFMVVRNKLTIERQDNDESGGRLVFE